VRPTLGAADADAKLYLPRAVFTLCTDAVVYMRSNAPQLARLQGNYRLRFAEYRFWQLGSCERHWVRLGLTVLRRRSIDAKVTK
jgi:hypothetical protein